MRQKPVISVIIPAYNYSKFLPDAIESVLNQTFSDFELIIVDDGSTDDTANVVRLFLRDSRARYFYQDNSGLSAARNTGIRAATGEFIALLDADDIWLPEKLEKQIRLFKDRPDVVLVYCMVKLIDENGNDFPHMSWPHKDNATYRDLMYMPWVVGSGSAVLIRRNIFDEVGLFDESMTSSEDSNMWIRILRHHECAYVDDILVKIRKHLGSMQTNLGRMEENNLRHIQKCIDLFPELEQDRQEAYFQVYKGLTYLAYMYNKKREMLVYYVKAGRHRPSFFFESIAVFLRKYFSRDRKLR